MAPAELDPPGPPQVSTWGSSNDALSRLRMPGQSSGAMPIPSTDAPAETFPPPLTGIPGSSAKRSPVIGARIPAQDTQNYATEGAIGERSSGGRFVVPGSGPQPAPTSRQVASTGADSAESQRLRTENKELRQLLDDMKYLLQEASDNEQQYAAREAELMTALGDRQRQVDELSSQLREIEDQITNGSLGPQQQVAPPKTRTELEDWSDELEQEAAKLAQDRKRYDEEVRQLREDEEGLESQMREMEVSMARERAMMARQETELKRLSAEIQHELEMMQRGDASLREQMQKFQRRAADVMQGRVGGPPPGRR